VTVLALLVAPRATALRDSVPAGLPTIRLPRLPGQPATGAASPRAGRAVAFALAQRGKPYRWGAEGPGAYDCSGLTWRAWQHAGLSWARMSAAGQWQWLHQHGHDIPATQLRPRRPAVLRQQPPRPRHDPPRRPGDRPRPHGRVARPGIPVRVVAVRWHGLSAAAQPLP
jgi:hypothetical protein